GLRLDRFSPNFANASTSGFGDVAPIQAYEHVYPLSDEPRANLAYYFRFTYAGVHPRTYVGPLLHELDRWRRVSRSSDLFFVDLGEALPIWDFRPGARGRLTVLR